MVHEPLSHDHPAICPNEPTWKGRYRLAGRQPVWIPIVSCDGHLEGVVDPRPVGSLDVSIR